MSTFAPTYTMAAPPASTYGTVGYTAAPNYSFPAAAPAYSFPMVGTQTLSAAPAYTFPSATPVMTQAPTISYATAAPVYQTMAAPVYQTPVVEAGPFLFTAVTAVAEPVVDTEVAEPAAVEGEAAAPSASYAAQLVNLIRGGSALEPVVAEQVVAEAVVAEPIVEIEVVEAAVVEAVKGEAAAPSASYAAQLVNLVRGGSAPEPVVAEQVVAEPVVAEPVVEIKVVEPAVVDSAAATPVVTYAAPAMTMAAPAYSVAATPSAAAPVTYSAPVEYSSLEDLLANSNTTLGATTGSYYLPSSASMLEIQYITPAVKVEEETVVATDGVVKKVVTKKKKGCC